MEKHFGDGTLRTHSGTVAVADAFKGVKLVGIYFSMHNCPPCREFTPVFAELYKDVNASEKVMEVVFCSGDKTDDEYEMYFKDMPWIALPRGDQRLRGIAQEFNVKGVPRLVMMKPDGTVLNDNCVQKMSQEGPVFVDELLAM